MTSPDHASGTDRAAEVAATDPGDRSSSISRATSRSSTETCSTASSRPSTRRRCRWPRLMAKVTDVGFIGDPNIVKVVADRRGLGAAISPGRRSPAARCDFFYQHIGIYGYRTRVPARIQGRLPESRLEQIEKLEQLRVLENGHPDPDDRDPPAHLERGYAADIIERRRILEERGLMSKYIFVTGGVLSGLGKGIAAASIGRLLESHGFKITLQKFDPYLNVDPGTMNPFQHGEVYVTDDGAETDLDLGHYERFTSTRTTKYHNWTAGKIYDMIIRKERRGEYLGKTVQVIPHVTDEIKNAFHAVSSDNDIVIVRDRRHGRRHREPALPRGHPPDAAVARPREHALRPPDARPLHRHVRRAEDQAHPAHGQGAAGHRHPARHPALPDGPLS